MSDETPTWDEFRTNYAMDYIHAVKGATPEDYIPKCREFDRAIAAHDAELRAEIAKRLDNEPVEGINFTEDNYEAGIAQGLSEAAAIVRDVTP